MTEWLMVHGMVKISLVAAAVQDILETIRRQLRCGMQK